jgi:hypothetical protein
VADQVTALISGDDPSDCGPDARTVVNALLERDWIRVVGYREVPALLTQERILDVIELTAESLQKLRGRPPKIVVCGLNPHAGEHGLFGEREEERIIIPAIEAGRAKGIAIEGPLPPDTETLFRFARDGDYNVKLTVTTVDQRTSSETQTVHVRTHDVAILSFAAPDKGKVGKAGSINVGIGPLRASVRQ